MDGRAWDAQEAAAFEPTRKRMVELSIPTNADTVALVDRIGAEMAENMRLREVAATMASTLRDVLLVVEARPDYPWQSGALKNQMREDVTAYELLGLDDAPARAAGETP